MKTDFAQQITGWDQHETKDEYFLYDRNGLLSFNRDKRQNQSQTDLPQINQSKNHPCLVRSPIHKKTQSHEERQCIEEYLDKFQKKIKQPEVNKSFLIDDLKSQYISLPLKSIKRAHYQLKHPIINSTDFYQKPCLSKISPVEYTNSQLFASSKQYSNQSYILRIKKQYLNLRLQNVSFQNDEKYKLLQQSQNIMRLTRIEQQANNFDTPQLKDSMKQNLDRTTPTRLCRYQMRDILKKKRPNLAQMSTQINQKLHYKLNKNKF